MKAVDFLFEWADNTSWKNHIINSILEGKEKSAKDLYNEVNEIINQNKVVKIVIKESTRQDDSLKLEVAEIKYPQNINALHNESEFKLGKKLNVFYGENGTGKSSYAKVFRKLANNYYTNQKDLNILPNVFTSTKTKQEQTIQVTYSYNERITEETININENHIQLGQINVFDSGSITPLLNSNLTFSVLPQGFNYFNKVISVLDAIKAEVDAEITEKEKDKGTVFSDSSFKIIQEEIIKILSEVKNRSRLQKYLDENYPIPQDVDAQILALDEQIKEMGNSNPAATIKLLTSQKGKLSSIVSTIKNLSEKLSEENIKKVNKLVSEYMQKVEEEKRLNEELSNKIKFLKVFNNQWLDFIKAGQTYYESIETSLPVENDGCIFCGQELKPQHIQLIETCFKFLNSDALIEKEKLAKAIGANKLGDFSFTFTKDDETLFGKTKLVERLKAVINLVTTNKELFQSCIEEIREVKTTLKLNFTDLTKEISNEITLLDDRLEALKKSNTEITECVTKIKKEKETLEKNKKLHNSTEQFNSWYIVNESISNLKKFKGNYSTNSLTIKAKDAFEKIVAGDYIKIFNDYCSELKVGNVDIGFTPHKGQTYRSKLVKDKYKVTDIMSEGEQNAIAMAEFATDLKIRNNFNTVLFDDPVSSLDYKRAEIFAKVIFQLSKERQVIVFTHNIMFYYFLYNACVGEKNDDNKFFKVDEYDKFSKGLVSESFSGRLETLTEMTKKIKQYQQKIASPKCLGDDLEATLETAYSDIRTWCELIVEEGFLKKIIRRYEPNIMFTKVSKIDVDFVEELPAVSDLFDRACRWMKGHSQPTETQNTKASREAFNDDYNYIIKIYEKYNS